jgi:hypothetical protein
VPNSQKRNDFAHWTVNLRIGMVDPEPTGPFLRRSYFDPKDKGIKYEVEDLVRSAVSFASLAEGMRLFAESLPIPPGSPPLV